MSAADDDLAQFLQRFDRVRARIVRELPGVPPSEQIALVSAIAHEEGLDPRAHVGLLDICNSVSVRHQPASSPPSLEMSADGVKLSGLSSGDTLAAAREMAALKSGDTAYTGTMKPTTPDKLVSRREARKTFGEIARENGVAQVVLLPSAILVVLLGALLTWMCSAK